MLNRVYEAAEFLEAEGYTHLQRWAKAIEARPAVRRGRDGEPPPSARPEGQLHERHDASDFEHRTQDKLDAAG